LVLRSNQVFAGTILRDKVVGVFCAFSCAASVVLC
jgi:hypothetical protein